MQMASATWDVKIHSKYLDDEISEYNKPINNINFLFQFILDSLENLYIENLDFKKNIDLILNKNDSKKNRKNEYFDKSDKYSKSIDEIQIKEDIKKITNGTIILSSEQLFFTVYHAKADVENIIKYIALKLNSEMDDFFIELNNNKYPNQKNTEQKIGETMESNNKIICPNHIFFNKIIFGPTGTGKSTLCDFYRHENHVEDNNLFRTTFYEEYSYYDFFGQYKPIVLRNGNTTLSVRTAELNEHTKKIDLQHKRISEHIITYQFVPGIFFNALIKAKYNQKNNKEKVFLIIEEINRGNCSSIFGDIFQLLDRNSNGESTYKLTLSNDVKRYLMDLLVDADQNESQTFQGIPSSKFFEVLSDMFFEDKISIPENLILVGTMNTSDQSLFPIDSAFKRRWDMEYCHINYNENLLKNTKIENLSIKWMDFLKIVNDRILYETKSEDKQIGQWFIKPNENNEISEKDCKNKLISYLYFDVFKHFTRVFNMSYSDLMNKNLNDILCLIKINHD